MAGSVLGGLGFTAPAGLSADARSLLLPRDRRVCAQRPSTHQIRMSAGKDRKVFFVLGNAGSGKGTQCEKLVDRFGLDHVSAGDLLRGEVASGSERGVKIGEIIKEGQIVPGSVTIELLKDAINETEANGVLIDGFPRNIEQAKKFVEDVSDFEFALYFDCPEEELMRRLVARGATSGRSDDNEESILKRFKTFTETCKPVVDMYVKEGKVHSVNAMRSEDEIFADLCPLFEESLRVLAK